MYTDFSSVNQDMKRKTLKREKSNKQFQRQREKKLNKRIR